MIQKKSSGIEQCRERPKKQNYYGEKKRKYNNNYQIMQGIE